jgi:methenyltetrahydrofolate cyclohydrolase
MPDAPTGGQTIGDYLRALASAAPAPGGGAAAGITAAQAAALLSMVCNLSRGQRYAAVADEIEAIERACSGLRDEMLALAEADARSFQHVVDAQRLPKATAAEKERRGQAIQQALQAAASTPLTLLDRSVALIPHALRLVEIGNLNLITDVGVAAHLARAAAGSASLNVRINTRAIRDRAFVDRVHGELEQALARMEAAAGRCIDAVEAVLARG